MTRAKKGCLVAFVVIGCGSGFLYWRYGGAVVDLWRGNVLQGFFQRTERTEWKGSTDENLRAIQIALSMYHDSEERFPDASGWMDAIEPRMRTNDVKDASVKLRRPDLAASGGYGYAINAAVAGRFMDDIRLGLKTPLVFETDVPGKNVSGNPARIGRPGGRAIALDGTLIRLPE